MGVLAAMLIVANAAAAVRADEWSEAHTQCYTDAMTLQTLSIAYLSGKTRVQAIETLGASRIPALVQKIDRVYADKPANYEEYGARIFLDCAWNRGLVVDEGRAKACVAESFLVASALIARDDQKSKSEVIGQLLACQTYGCKDKGLPVKEIVDELYGTSEPRRTAAENRFKRCLLGTSNQPDHVVAQSSSHPTWCVSFHEVHSSLKASKARQQGVPSGYRIYPQPEGRGEKEMLLREEPALHGGDVVDVQPGIDPRTSSPVVSLRFNARGADKLASVTRANFFRQLAIVVDGRVVVAPVVQEPILGGEIQISTATPDDAARITARIRSGKCAGPAG